VRDEFVQPVHGEVRDERLLGQKDLEHRVLGVVGMVTHPARHLRRREAVEYL